MAQLGAEGVLDTPHIPELAAGQSEQAPSAEEAVGGCVTIHFAGVGVWCRGEVLAYDSGRKVSSDKLQPFCTHWQRSSSVCIQFMQCCEICTGLVACLPGFQAVSLSWLDTMSL